MGQVSSHRLAIAARYWNTAKLVLDHQERSFEHMEPVGYLLAMAAEISLKAFLSDRGWDDRELANVLRHDLRKSLREAIACGLLVSNFECGCILNMREAHMSHFNRYGMPAVDGSLTLGAVLLTDEMMALDCVGAIIERLTGPINHLKGRHTTKALSWPHTPFAELPVTLARFENIEREAALKLGRISAVNSDMERRRLAEAGLNKSGTDACP